MSDEMMKKRKATTVYRVTRHTPGDDLPNEPSYFIRIAAALKYAQGMARPGAFSSDPGDEIVVERVVSEKIAVFKRT